jgi:Tripartite tricarboxylate transporter TctB family
MRLAIRSPKDFWTGVLYVAFGGAAFWLARDYGMGSASRMGAGYFPSVLSALLMVFGVVSIARSFIVPGEAIGRFALKAAALIVGATVAFGFLLPRAGLVAALVVLALVAASASEKFRFEWKAVAGLVGLVAFCALVFVKGLGVPMPLVGSWFAG